MKKIFFFLGFLFCMNFGLMSQEVVYLGSSDAIENIKMYLNDNPSTVTGSVGPVNGGRNVRCSL